MKQLQLDASGAGPSVEDVQWPVPQPHDVLIKVKAALVNVPSHQSLLRHLGSELAGDGDAQRPVLLGGAVVGTVVQHGLAVDADRLPADQLVLGLVPHNGTSTTFAEHCLVPEWSCVAVAQGVDARRLVAATGGLLKALTCLQYRSTLMAGDQVLVCRGASANHHLVCQYATRLGGHVTATARTSKDKLYLSSQKQLVAVAEHSGSLADRSQELTGGLGYNVIFAEQWRRESDVTRRAPGAMDRSDSATTLESEEDGPEDGAGGASLPLLTDLLACLAVGGVLVVEERLRLTEAEEELLVDAGATVQYYSPFLWTQGTAFQGHLLHMLQDIVRLVAQDLVQPHLERTVSLAELAAQWSDLTHAHRGPGSLVLSFR